MNQAGASYRVRAHAGWELRLLLRNGEQLLLMFVIPLALLIGLDVSGISLTGGGLGTAVPTVIAVSVMATSFTSLAIGTGFERRSGALEFLGTTPLTRMDLLLGKFGATVVLAVISIVAIVVTGIALGWSPRASWPAALVVVAVGVAALSSWAIALAGLLRAEAVLALANGFFIVLMVFGGVLIPPSSMPAPLGLVASALPSGGLANGLRMAMDAQSWPWSSLGVLACWAIVGALVARRTFRWEP